MNGKETGLSRNTHDRRINILEKKVDIVEDYMANINNYVAEIEQELNEKHDNLVEQVNAFITATTNKIEDIESKEDISGS